MVCSRCSSHGALRSRVRWYERSLVVATRIRPYRCFTCQRRFWARPAAEREAPETSGTDLSEALSRPRAVHLR